ncbi:MAG: 4-hydroxythreonine-4-phosphate dehydrogenase PdxA [Syntrophobacterales bacterium]|nr:4-hydroxythreonine-4-phosphate dehydrogenase PdxA [Syntrophobacterales bacterium]
MIYDNSYQPVIAITMGDPCGIGPEIICKALIDQSFTGVVKVIIVGENRALENVVNQLRLSISFQPVNDIKDAFKGGKDFFPVINPFPLGDRDITPTMPTSYTARATIKYIEEAVQMALDGVVDAICTAPINKTILSAHGFPFPGHTEFIKYLTGSDKAVMMLAGDQLRVSLVTIHEPIRRISELITIEKICETIEVTASSLETYFALPHPRVAVCGLNPHAGESGLFGDEEEKIISPAIKTFLPHRRWHISGPHPPDTVFYRAARGIFDAVVAMYHDQGLIPLKLLHFDDAVNVTLGLPIIRTSVDHGTAYDIAGKGIASPGSLKAAIRLAAQMVRSKKQGYE